MTIHENDKPHILIQQNDISPNDIPQNATSKNDIS
jgi:hypothetical protein